MTAAPTGAHDHIPEVTAINPGSPTRATVVHGELTTRAAAVTQIVEAFRTAAGSDLRGGLVAPWDRPATAAALDCHVTESVWGKLLTADAQIQWRREGDHAAVGVVAEDAPEALTAAISGAGLSLTDPETFEVEAGEANEDMRFIVQPFAHAAADTEEPVPVRLRTYRRNNWPELTRLVPPS